MATYRWVRVTNDGVWEPARVTGAGRYELCGRLGAVGVCREGPAIDWQDAGDADERAELRTLLAAFETAHQRSVEQLNRTDEALDAALDHLRDRSS